MSTHLVCKQMCWTLRLDKQVTDEPLHNEFKR